jgi:hypothetical protein
MFELSGRWPLNLRGIRMIITDQLPNFQVFRKVHTTPASKSTVFHCSGTHDEQKGAFQSCIHKILYLTDGKLQISDQHKNCIIFNITMHAACLSYIDHLQALLYII